MTDTSTHDYDIKVIIELAVIAFVTKLIPKAPKGGDVEESLHGKIVSTALDHVHDYY